jgi:hypothetical protein
MLSQKFRVEIKEGDVNWRFVHPKCRMHGHPQDEHGVFFTTFEAAEEVCAGLDAHSPFDVQFRVVSSQI